MTNNMVVILSLYAFFLLHNISIYKKSIWMQYLMASTPTQENSPSDDHRKRDMIGILLQIRLVEFYLILIVLGVATIKRNVPS
jgi:hypothetical protein